MVPGELATAFPVTCAHGPSPHLAFAFWGAMYPKLALLNQNLKTYPHLELCKNKDCLQRRGWNGNLRSLNNRQDTVHPSDISMFFETI